MKLHELCDLMEIGNIKVFEKEEGDDFSTRKFTYPARSSLKSDYYNADVLYFTVHDSTIIANVKRGNDNGRMA